MSARVKLASFPPSVCAAVDHDLVPGRNPPSWGWRLVMGVILGVLATYLFNIKGILYRRHGS